MNKYSIWGENITWLVITPAIGKHRLQGNLAMTEVECLCEEARRSNLIKFSNNSQGIASLR